MLLLKTLLVLVMMAPTIILAGCPDFTYKCPSGESFEVGTCWSWRRFNCQTCRDIVDQMKSRCPKYSCDGSTRNWYNRRGEGCDEVGITGYDAHLFGAACAIHGICFATPGRKKSECDSDFLHNARQTCQYPGALSLVHCTPKAYNHFVKLQNSARRFNNQFSRTCEEVDI